MVKTLTEDGQISDNKIPDYLKNEDLSYYGGQVIRLGGHGSFIDQISAWLKTTGYGNLKPGEDWVHVIYNRPGDLIHVDCREGYTMISCAIDGEDQEINKNRTFSCSSFLKDKFRNDIFIECRIEIKENNK